MTSQPLAICDPTANPSVVPRSRTIPESVPETLGPRPSYVFSNRGIGSDAQTEAAGPSLHFGNTPAPPTMSPNSSRKTRGSKASPRGAADTVTGDQIKPSTDKTNPTEVRALKFDEPTEPQPGATSKHAAAQQDAAEGNAATALDHSDSAVGLLQATLPAATQVQFLEPTQLQATLEATQAIEATQPQLDMPVTTATIPATQAQLEDIDQHDHIAAAEEEHHNMAIIPETDEANFREEEQVQQSVVRQKGNRSAEQQVEQAIEAIEAAVQASPPPPGSPPGPDSQPLGTAEEIGRLEEELRAKWLGSFCQEGSEEILTGAVLTAREMVTQLSSLHGEVAEAEQLVERWNEEVVKGDELCTLRLHILSALTQETGKAMFGADAAKLSDEASVRSLWTWLAVEALCHQERKGADEGTPVKLLLNLTFKADPTDNKAGARDDSLDYLGPLVPEVARVAAEYLCTKEETAAREAKVLAAEAAGEEYALSMEKAPNGGTLFTDEELAERAKAALEALKKQQRAEVLITATAGDGPSKLPAGDGPDALEVDSTHPLSLPKPNDTMEIAKDKESGPQLPILEAQPAAPSAPAPLGDGPDALQVELTAPQASENPPSGPHQALINALQGVPNHQVDPERAEVMIQSPVAAHALPLDLGLAWMAGGWAPPQASPPGSAPTPALGHAMYTVPASDQDTPPGLVRKLGAGDGAAAADGDQPSRLVESSMVPETQPEHLKTGGKVSDGGFLPLPSVIPATAPEDNNIMNDGSGDGAGPDSRVLPLAGSFQLPLQLTGPEECFESQPVGSQDIQKAMRITGLLADDLIAASQDTEMGTLSLGKLGGGGGTMLPPPPKSRLAPKEVGYTTRAKVAAAVVEAQPQHQQGEEEELLQGGRQTRRKESKREVNAERRRERLGRVMAPKGVRPDLGMVTTRLVTRRSLPGQAKHDNAQEAAVADPGVPKVPNAGGTGTGAGTDGHPHFLLSGLQDTAECYEVDGSDAAYAQPDGPGNATGMPGAVDATRPQPDNKEQAGKKARISPRRLSSPLKAVAAEKTLHKKPSPKNKKNEEPRIAPARAPQEVHPAVDDIPDFAPPQNESDPYRFPSLPGNSPGQPSRRSPRRPVAAPAPPAVSKRDAAVPAPPPPPQPALKEPKVLPPAAPPAPLAHKYYQPAPERQIIGGLLVSRVPHPMIQTAPDAASMENEQIVIDDIPRAPPQEAPGPAAPPAPAADAAAAAGRRVSPRKRKEGPGGGAGEVTPEHQVVAKRQKKGVNQDGNGGINQAGQAIACDSEDQTIAQRWESTGRRKSKPAEKPAQDLKTPVSPPRPKRAAKEAAAAAVRKMQHSGGRKHLDPLPSGVTLGCPKCRYSKNGCARCRKRAEKNAAAAEKEQQLPQVASPAPPQALNHPELAAKVAVKPASVAAKATISRRISAPAAPPHALHLLAPDASTSRGVSGPLQGMCFLVSGTGDKKETKGAIEELIISLGGRILPDIPPPHSVQSSPAPRRLSHDLRSPALPPTVDAVVADKISRRAKCIYAAIKGIPVVTPAWIQACKATKKRVGWKSKHVLLGPKDPPPAPVFAGLRVHLRAADRGLAQGMTQLMQHAGAQMTGQPKDSAEHGATCDLIIIDEDVASDAKDSLERLARRLHVPCHPREWAIKAMQEGTLPDEWAPATKRRSRKRTAAQAEVDEGEAEVQAPALQGAGADEAHDAGPIGLEEMEEDGAGAEEQEEEEEEDPQGSPELMIANTALEQAQHTNAPPAAALTTRTKRGGAAPKAAGAAAQDQKHQHQDLVALRRSNRKGNNTAAAVAAPESAQPLAKQQRVPSPQAAAEVALPTASAIPRPSATLITPQSIAPAQSPAPGGFTWEGEQIAPPHGASATARRYYNAVHLGDSRVAVGSFVELAPPPGEIAPRVAQVAALWAERGVNGEDRPYGRFLRYFRPQDTPLGLPFLQSAQGQVFRSNVEEQLPLAAVVRGCTVSFPASVGELAQATPGPMSSAGCVVDYVCMLQYDPEQVALTYLPPPE